MGLLALYALVLINEEAISHSLSWALGQLTNKDSDGFLGVCYFFYHKILHDPQSQYCISERVVPPSISLKTLPRLGYGE